MTTQQFDLTCHHRKQSQLDDYEFTSASMLSKIEMISGDNQWLKPHLAVYSSASHSKSTYLSTLINALLIDWPDAHCAFLLARAAELQKLSLQCWAMGDEPITLTFEGASIVVTRAEGILDEGTIEEWLDAVSINALVRDQQAINSICQLPENHFRCMNPQFRPTDIAHYNILKAFYLNEQDSQVQQELLDGLIPVQKTGYIETMSIYEGAEKEYRCLFGSLCKIVEQIWQGDHQAVEQAVKEASQANFYAYTYIRAALNGTKVGDIQESYLDVNALFHWHIMGIIATYFDRTGKKLSFSSAYMSDWIMYNEGPNGRELLNNPPEFSEAVVSAGRNKS